MKVYVISYEDFSSRVYTSGVSYVFDSMEKAQKKLEEIKDYEINYYKDNDVDYIEDITKDTETGFIIDFIEDFTKYDIKEMQVE